MKLKRISAAFAVVTLSAAAPAMAEDNASDGTSPGETANPQAGTVFDGDWLTIGVGAMYGPSYSGSDDYVLFPVPLVQGKVGGVAISPRAGGVALDFIPDPKKGVGIALGPTFRIRADRDRQTEDAVAASAGELKTAIEVGGAAGLSFPGVLNPYDSVNVGVDVTHDINGAHGGTVITPSVSYFTPLSKGMVAAVALSAEHGDRRFMNYYYSVNSAQSTASGLPLYTAGAGWTKAGANLLVSIDLDGDLTNGGLGVVFIGGYSRMLGDAKASPFTSVVGSADQWLGGIGIGYTF